MSTVRLRDIRHLEKVLIAHEKAMREAVEAGMVNSARRGVAVAIQSMTKFTQRPFSTGTYANSWLSVPVDGGAAVANSANHAIFIERGRLPGKAPPLAPILEWVYQKRLAKRAGDASTKKLAKRIAMGVAQKIKHKGIKARPVLEKSMPSITKFTVRESKRAVARVSRNPPK